MKLLLSILLLGFTVKPDLQEKKGEDIPTVLWEFSLRKVSDETLLVMTAHIQNGWHIYSQFTPEGGPIPTSFSFEENKGYTMEGKVKEPEPEKHYDPNFQLDVWYFSNKAEFTQKIKLKDKNISSVKGTVTYMVCNDQMCLPPVDVPFEIKLK